MPNPTRITCRTPVIALVPLLVAVSLCSSCTTDVPDAPAAGARVTDSTGVALVHNASAIVDTSRALEEVLRIGVINGPEWQQFHQIRGITLDAMGRIYVADGGSQSIRVFDAGGNYVRTIGSSGNGPGEFTGLGPIGVWRDTVYANARNGLVELFFDTAGTYLGTRMARLPEGARLGILGATPTGWLVEEVGPRRSGDPVPGMEEFYATIRRVQARDFADAAASRAAADSLMTPVAQYRHRRVFWHQRAGGARLTRQTPFFEPVGFSAVDGRGRVHVAAGWPYRIDTYDTNRKLLRRVSRAHDSIPVDPFVAEGIARAEAHYSSTAGSSDIFRWRASLPRVGWLPVTGEIFAAREGELWVQRIDLMPDPASRVWVTSTALLARTVWDVLDPDGILRYSVLLPPGFDMRAVQPGTAIGIQRDENDVQYVVKYVVRS